jgi:hypothetical protein
VWLADSRKPVQLNKIRHPPQPRPDICRQCLDLGRHHRVQGLDGPAAHAEIDIQRSCAASKRAADRSPPSGLSISSAAVPTLMIGILFPVNRARSPTSPRPRFSRVRSRSAPAPGPGEVRATCRVPIRNWRGQQGASIQRPRDRALPALTAVSKTLPKRQSFPKTLRKPQSFGKETLSVSFPRPRSAGLLDETIAKRGFRRFSGLRWLASRVVGPSPKAGGPLTIDDLIL